MVSAIRQLIQTLNISYWAKKVLIPPINDVYAYEIGK
jgi:hypothetical protein